MKKMISLAVILSCVLSVPAFADRPERRPSPGAANGVAERSGP